MTIADYLFKTLTLFNSHLSSIIKIEENHFILVLRNPNFLRTCLAVLKNSSLFRCNTLVELTAIDNPEEDKFILSYILLSVEYNFRLILKVPISPRLSPTCPSIVDIYPNANWSEREIRDMFGIFFLNNPDLRRLLTDYGFEGYPLRKDFPLTGYVEVRYSDKRAAIIYTPVELAQDYRLFSFSSP